MVVMRKLLLSMLVLFAAQGLFGQVAKNVTLAGHITSPSDLNDCWGYTANGREYALAGKQSGGVVIYDVTNPASPSLLQTLPGVASIWRDLKTWQNYAYVTNEDGDGLRIINLSNLPGTVTYKDTIIGGNNTAHNIWIDEFGFAYVVGGGNNSGIDILDLTNPWYPNLVGQYTSRYVHDVYVRNNLAYLGEINDGRLTVLDVTNKSNIITLGTTTYQNSFTHNTWLNDAGNVCFTTDELAEAYVYSWDVSNPSNLNILDGIRSSLSNGTATPHNVHVKDDYLVISYYRDGMVVVDASRPHNLIEVGYYDTSPLSGGGYDANWGAYPFFPSGTAIASDQDDGLFVFDINYIRGCYLEGQVTDAVSGLPIYGASIDILTTSANDASDANGEYATGLVDAGTYTVTYSKFGYQDSTITVNLSNGQLVIRDIPLRPLNRVEVTVNVIEAGTGSPIPSAEVLFIETSGAIQAPYTTNSNGQVNDQNFIAGSYNVIAGKWGYRSNQVSVNATQTVNNITISLEKGYYDDFALDFGWIASGNAATGMWEKGEPIGTFGFGNTPFNPELDLPNDISDECYVTGNGGGGIGDDDIDNGEVILTSPSMDLSSYGTPVLKYYRWFANGGGQGIPNDTLRIEIDNGQTSVVLSRVIGVTQNFWKQDSFVVSNYIAVTGNMKVRFIAGDYNPGHVAEAGIDGFEVIDREALAIQNPEAYNAQLNIFPNPVGANTTVRFELAGIYEEAAQFELRDALGKIVFSKSVHTSSGEFTLPNTFANGMYFGSLRVGNRILKTVKVIK